MRFVLVGLLLLLPDIAWGQITGAPRSVFQGNGMTRATVALSFSQSMQVTIVDATLLDGRGQSFPRSDWPSDFGGIPSSCKVGETVAAGSTHLVSIPFKGNGVAPYTMSIHFETPDPSVMFGCRKFSIDVEGLK